jgi:amidohydrolase
MDNVKELLNIVERYVPVLDELSIEVWKNPELGFEEFIACELQCNLLKKWGFEVSKNYCGFETAYRCEYGNGKPVFAITSEYDALPGVDHGCGHNLICATALGAFISLTTYMKENNIPGKVVLIGTPAEESGSSKVKIVKSGAFDGVDAAMMVHPNWTTTPDRACLSIKRFDVTFIGKAAHAGGSPELGINALDAVNLVFAGVNAWRQQLPESSRVHGVVTEGGLKPNVIPDRAACCFYVRADCSKWQNLMNERFINIVKGAALMTGCEYEINENSVGTQARKPSRLMNAQWIKNIQDLGLPVNLTLGPGRGSSDFGDVSQAVPAIHPYIGISENDAEVAVHSKEFAQLANTKFALKQMHYAAAAMANIGLKVLTDAEFCQNLKIEFSKN